MLEIESLVLVGGPATGKATIANKLGTQYSASEIVMPSHYATRPYQPGDDLPENVHIDQRNFEAGVSEGFINPVWAERPNEQLEYHGFENMEYVGRFAVEDVQLFGANLD